MRVEGIVIFGVAHSVIVYRLDIILANCKVIYIRRGQDKTRQHGGEGGWTRWGEAKRSSCLLEISMGITKGIRILYLSLQ